MLTWSQRYYGKQSPCGVRDSYPNAELWIIHCWHYPVSKWVNYTRAITVPCSNDLISYSTSCNNHFDINSISCGRSSTHVHVPSYITLVILRLESSLKHRRWFAMSATESSHASRFENISEMERSTERSLASKSKQKSAKRCALPKRWARMVEVATLTFVIACAIVLFSLPPLLHLVKKVSFHMHYQNACMHEESV